MKKLNVRLGDNVYTHVILWAIFITYELSYLYLASGKLGNFWDFAPHYLLNMILLYFNTWCLKKTYAEKNWLLLMVLIIVLEVAVYLCIHFIGALLFVYLKLLPNIDFHSQLRLAIIQEVYRALYFIGISFAYWFALALNAQKKLVFELNNKQLTHEKAIAEMEKNLMQAKNAYLQSQLNPHLLFNTLNFIYNSVRKISEKSATAIMLLADMMRYSLSNASDEGMVGLQKEIDHIFNLIKLNQLRFNEKLNLKIDVGGTFDDELIIPLLLLTFVENIYKHGDLTDPSFAATVSIHCENHLLKMVCINKKKKANLNQGWGIGIKNAETRLAIYYPGRHEIKIADAGPVYMLTLELQLS